MLLHCYTSSVHFLYSFFRFVCCVALVIAIFVACDWKVRPLHKSFLFSLANHSSIIQCGRVRHVRRTHVPLDFRPKFSHQMPCHIVPLRGKELNFQYNLHLSFSHIFFARIFRRYGSHTNDMSVLHCTLIHTNTCDVCDVSGTYDFNRIAVQHSSSGISLQFVHRVRRNVRARTYQMLLGECEWRYFCTFPNTLAKRKCQSHHISEMTSVKLMMHTECNTLPLNTNTSRIFILVRIFSSFSCYRRAVFMQKTCSGATGCWWCCLFSGDKCINAFSMYTVYGGMVWTVRAADANAEEKERKKKLKFVLWHSNIDAMMTITFEVGRGCHYCCCSFSYSNRNK